MFDQNEIHIQMLDFIDSRGSNTTNSNPAINNFPICFEQSEISKV